MENANKIVNLGPGAGRNLRLDGVRDIRDGTRIGGDRINNDHSRKVDIKQEFNTKIQASDAKSAASAFQRTNERLAGMNVRHLKSAVR